MDQASFCAKLKSSLLELDSYLLKDKLINKINRVSYKILSSELVNRLVEAQFIELRCKMCPSLDSNASNFSVFDAHMECSLKV